MELITHWMLALTKSLVLKRKFAAEQQGEYHKNDGQYTDQEPEGVIRVWSWILTADVSEQHGQKD